MNETNFHNSSEFIKTEASIHKEALSQKVYNVTSYSSSEKIELKARLEIA